MSPTQMISTYESIAAVMARMRAAAQSAQWERLSALERDCSKLVATLRFDAAPPALTSQQLQRKSALIRQLLAEDAEIRRHTEPWMEELKSLINSTGKSRRISRAYDLGGPR